MMTESPEYYGSQLSPAYQRDLNIVYRNARHLQGLINDVLDLARIDAAQMSITPEKIDPATLAAEAVDITRGLIEGRGLKLYTKFDPDLPQLWVDPIRIRQVLINLLSNAARSTEQGSITVNVRQEGKYIVFSVADTGVGIAPENLERIFEEFLQVDGSTRRRNSGVGLGLAISRRFIELHDGNIWAESQVASGSTFYFRLPIKPANPIKLSGKYLPAQTISTEIPVLAVATKSIAAATLLTRYLHDFRTVIVPDIEEAQEAVRATIPQAVLIDQVDEAPGITRLGELAQEWELPGVPFISCPLPGEKQIGQDLKAEGYLVKPVSRSTLWNTLRQFGMDIDTVLVIDDDLDFVQLMSRMLEDNPVRQYRVISAYSGREGLDMVRLHQPDIVFLDLQLQDMNGFRFVEKMRSLPEQQSIPIVIISAQDSTDNQEILHGGMIVTKQEGLTPGEIVRWVQAITDIAVASSSPLLAKRSAD